MTTKKWAYITIKNLFKIKLKEFFFHRKLSLYVCILLFLYFLYLFKIINVISQKYLSV